MERERQPDIDSLKGLAILFVVLSHCDANGRFFFNYLFSFTMPLFFAVAGYLTARGDGFRPYLFKKFKRLILPYWFWIVASADIFLAAFRAVTGEYALIVPYIAKAFAFMSRPLMFSPVMNLPLWFLPALFAVAPFLYGCARLSDKALCRLGVSLAVLSPAAQARLSGEFPFGAPALPPALFFAIAGILAARHRSFLRKTLSVPMTIVLLATGAGLTCGGVFSDLFSVRPAFFVAALASIAGWRGAAARLDCRLLRFFGGNSLSFLALHCPLIVQIKYLMYGGYFKTWQTTTAAQSWTLFALTVAASSALIWAGGALNRKFPQAKPVGAVAAVLLFLYFDAHSP